MRRYVQLWRLPSAPLLIVAGVVGRLPAAITPLALLLFLADRTGSFGVGGIAVGVYGLSTAAVAPVLGRFAEVCTGAAPRRSQCTTVKNSSQSRM